MHIATPNLLVLSLVIQVQQIKRGDEILVKTDKNLVKELQVGHGEWNEAMVSVSFFLLLYLFFLSLFFFFFSVFFLSFHSTFSQEQKSFGRGKLINK